MNKKEVFEMLEKLNIAQVIVEFSGGDDEGGTDNIIAENNEGHPVTFTENEDKLVEALQLPIYERYGSFTNQPFVNGELIWDTKNKSLTVKGRQVETSWIGFQEEI